jgi:4-hydroxybenzoate polyprenyltransferase
MSRLRALLATLRIANAPSVVSNVWLGVVLGDFLIVAPGRIAFANTVPPMLAGLLLYFAGNLANDWFDRDWDREHRPERALPSGLFPARAYLAAAVTFAMTGLAVAFSTTLSSGLAAAFIFVCVVIYTLIHKRTAWSVIPMGLCRTGLYLLGFASSLPEDHLSRFRDALGTERALMLAGEHLSLGVGLLAYIAGLSMSARYEGMADAPPGPKVIARSLLILPLVAMPCWLLPLIPAYGWVGMIPYGAWLALCLTRYRRPIPAHVSALLAGIPLVDAIFLLPAGIAVATEISSYREIGVLIAVLPLIAFVLGRLLQKVAPAT